MRIVRVPRPDAVWSVRIEGPVSPGARDVGEAGRRLDRALDGVAALDAGLGAPASLTAWCVARIGARFTSGALVQQTLWIDRSERASDLAAVVAAHLQDAGFLARRGPRPQAVDPALAPRIVYLRCGELQQGLGARAPDLLGLVEPIEELRRDVAFDHEFRYRPQPCPRCGVVDHPAELVSGFPTREALLAVALGEAAFGGCDVDERRPVSARCRRCGHDYQAR